MKKSPVPVLFVALILGALLGALALRPATAQISSPYSAGPRATTFANLGAPSNGQHRYCSDCQATAPCTSGGSGAFASRVGGAWNCSTGSAGTTLTDSASLRSALSDETGTGSAVFANTPTLVTPVLGAATATSINGNTFTSGSYTLTGGASKTFTFNNSLTLSGTDGTTITFPSTSATVARTDAGNTWTGNQLSATDGGNSIGATSANRFHINAFGLAIGGATSTGGEARFVTGTGAIRILNGNVQVGSGVVIGWSSGDPTAAALDTELRRGKAGVVGLNSSSTTGGTYRAVALSPAQITADQDNYNPGGSSLNIRLSSDASRSVTGLSISQVDGEHHYVWNVGSNDIVLANESASSTAANRFTTSTGANLTLAANKCALLIYDGTTSRWRAVLLP